MAKPGLGSWLSSFIKAQSHICPAALLSAILPATLSPWFLPPPSPSPVFTGLLRILAAILTLAVTWLFANTYLSHTSFKSVSLRSWLGKLWVILFLYPPPLLFIYLPGRLFWMCRLKSSQKREKDFFQLPTLSVLTGRMECMPGITKGDLLYKGARPQPEGPSHPLYCYAEGLNGSFSCLSLPRQKATWVLLTTITQMAYSFKKIWLYQTTAPFSTHG